MVDNLPDPGGRRLAMAALALALLVPAPAAAAETTATLTVRARVVDDCHIRLPDLVPPHARGRLPDHVEDLIVHRCRRPVHPRIEAEWLPGPARDRHHRATSIIRQHDHGRARVLITISY